MKKHLRFNVASLVAVEGAAPEAADLAMLLVRGDAGERRERGDDGRELRVHVGRVRAAGAARGVMGHPRVALILSRGHAVATCGRWCVRGLKHGQACCAGSSCGGARAR